MSTLAVATYVAIPVERISRRTVGDCGSTSSLSTTPHFCRIYSLSGLFYWPLALLAVYALVSYFYTVKSRELGVETSAKAFVVPGILIAALLSLASYLLFLFSSGHRPILGVYFIDPSNSIIFRLLSPAFSIGLALLFLARFEKNRLLLILDLIYCVVVLWPPARGVHSRGFWSLAPYRMIDGGLLLLAGILFALAQRSSLSRRA